MLTINQIRRMFFETFTQFASEYRTNKVHNQYSTDCRCTFVDFVDSLLKNNEITETTCKNVVLGRIR